MGHPKWICLDMGPEKFGFKAKFKDVWPPGIRFSLKKSSNSNKIMIKISKKFKKINFYAKRTLNT